MRAGDEDGVEARLRHGVIGAGKCVQAAQGFLRRSSKGRRHVTMLLVNEGEPRWHLRRRNQGPAPLLPREMVVCDRPQERGVFKVGLCMLQVTLRRHDETVRRSLPLVIVEGCQGEHEVRGVARAHRGRGWKTSCWGRLGVAIPAWGMGPPAGPSARREHKAKARRRLRYWMGSLYSWTRQLLVYLAPASRRPRREKIVLVVLSRAAGPKAS